MDVEKTGESNALPEAFAVEVLHMVREAQQQHGLRHGDYQRYRSYCTRRLRRIRKSLHFPQGSKYKVQPKKITEEMLTDVKYLFLPLVSAERAWSYAMQLKSEANTEPRKRFHLSARLRKAVGFAEEFAKLCESNKVDARTKLEAQAYFSWMKATLLFELENWSSSIEFFTKAKTIYEKLASAFTEDIQALYHQRVEEIAPNIRYCAYNIGDETAINDLMQMRLKSGKEDMLTTKIDELLSQTREKQTSTLSEVTWRGHVIPVKNEAVRAFLLSVQASDKELAATEDVDSKVSIYGSLLNECIDALQSLRDELKNDPIFKATQRGQKAEGKISKVQLLHTYVTYLRQTKTIDRNLLMVESLKVQLGKVQEGKKMVKPQDIARLYDIIIQNLADIPNLVGLEDDVTILAETETQMECYKAFRCFYIAQTYASAKKWAEALALYEQVLIYAKGAVAGYKKITGNHFRNPKSEIESLQTLIKDVDGLKYSCHAASILDLEDTTDQMAAVAIKPKKPLVDRLDDFVDDATLTGKKPNLVPFPPDFEPVQCKPLFFDLALNHVEFPSLDDRMEQKKASGITGMVKGWLWGK
ncbi:signal recognition particle subunit SRP68-like [Lineus longissimus]|uniref:signal recognition particle subunit SRP68-like n=1 Tax=Lineus longissimus TaxID=88925 RepID=UPI00315D3F57